MNGLDLSILGYKLIRIGQQAIPGTWFSEAPDSARTVLMEVFEHPGSTIGAITTSTGFPQSLVSAAVARFRDAGVMVTEPDPADRRRTLVSPAPGAAERGRRIVERTSVDGALAAALGAEPDEVKDIVATLESLAARLAAASGRG